VSRHARDSLVSGNRDGKQEAYLRLIDSCITQLRRLKDLLGPVTRVKQKKKNRDGEQEAGGAPGSWGR